MGYPKDKCGLKSALLGNDMKKLLIATNNKGKVKELQELLKELNVELVTPADINLNLDVEEDGVTYIENASKKATTYFLRKSFMLK